jgi:hypothetical protein
LFAVCLDWWDSVFESWFGSGLDIGRRVATGLRHVQAGEFGLTDANPLKAEGATRTVTIARYAEETLPM